VKVFLANKYRTKPIINPGFDFSQYRLFEDGEKDLS